MNLHSASADHNILMTSSLKLDLMFRNHNVVKFGAKLSVVVMMFFDKASTDKDILSVAMLRKKGVNVMRHL